MNLKKIDITNSLRVKAITAVNSLAIDEALDKKKLAAVEKDLVTLFAKSAGDESAAKRTAKSLIAKFGKSPETIKVIKDILDIKA